MNASALIAIDTNNPRAASSKRLALKDDGNVKPVLIYDGGSMVGKLTTDKKLSGSFAPVLMNQSHPTYGMSRNDLLARVLNARGQGNYEVQEFSGNEAADFGNEFEPTILRKAAERLGLDVDTEVSEVYHYGELFSVSLDGILKNTALALQAQDGIYLMNGAQTVILEGDGVLESKLTSAPFTEVPPPYRGPWQLQMQMMCYGAKWGVIATLYQGVRLVLNVYEADPDMQAQLIEAAEDFYARLEGPDWYPAIDGADAARTWGRGEDDLPPVDLEPISETVMKYLDARRAAKAAEALAKALEPEIMSQMAVHEKAFLKDENGDTMVEISWPTRSFKAQPEKIVPAKPARFERQKSISVSAKWLGDDQ